MSIISRLNSKFKHFEKDFETYNHIYISKSAILDNFDLYKSLSNGKQIFPVLKSNAYGHGLEQIAEILKERTFPYIAVDGYFEGLKIHDISDQPVLVMGSIKPVNYKNMDIRGCAFVVHQKEIIDVLARLNKKVKIHLELETGMGRHGVRVDELDDFLKSLKKYPKLELEGIMTHLADADNFKSNKYTDSQVNKYDNAVEKILSYGFSPKYLHIAQSAGTIKAISKYTNSVRIGIGLYGINPLDALDRDFNKLEQLKPALTLASSIAKIFRADKGISIGYGCSYVTKRNSQIGVLPIGYYEGIPRSLSNLGQVGYNNTFLPIVGKVCMNHIMIDISDIRANLEDEVIIISPKKTDINSVSEISKRFGVFDYELLSGLNQNIRRIIVS